MPFPGYGPTVLNRSNLNNFSIFLGPRLSTVVDEVMTSKSPMNEDEDSLIKCSEIEYASGGLLSFNEDHSTNINHCVSIQRKNFFKGTYFNEKVYMFENVPWVEFFMQFLLKFFSSAKNFKENTWNFFFLAPRYRNVTI